MSFNDDLYMYRENSGGQATRLRRAAGGSADQ